MFLRCALIQRRKVKEEEKKKRKKKRKTDESFVEWMILKSR